MQKHGRVTGSQITNEHINTSTQPMLVDVSLELQVFHEISWIYRIPKIAWKIP